MSVDPKQFEEKLFKVFNARKITAPGKTFGGITFAQFEAPTRRTGETHG